MRYRVQKLAPDRKDVLAVMPPASVGEQLPFRAYMVISQNRETPV